SRLQGYAEEAMVKQMKTLQQKFADQLDRRQLQMAATQKLRHLPQYKELEQAGLTGEEIVRALKKPVKTKIWTWDGIKEVDMSFYDSVKHHMQFLQAGILAIEPGTGDIRVWVGGI